MGVAGLSDSPDSDDACRRHCLDDVAHRHHLVLPW